MSEEFIFKRRNRLKKHFVNTSLVLLYCYKKISDAAKITFQIIDAFDWESKDTGDSKGYVFPAVETLAKIRNTSIRTIQRHILELIQAKLLTRIRRKYKPSILLIEEVSDEEAQKYFDLIEGNAPAKKQEDIPEQNLRNDKNVVSAKASETTKMSFAYMKENEIQKENEINVNENLKISSTDISSISSILSRYDIDNHGIPKNKLRKKKVKIKPDDIIKRDYFAQEIAEALQDPESLGCYRVIAENVPQGVIFETLASVKETWVEGKIKKSRGALFVDIIKTYCQSHEINLQFKQTKSGERVD